MTTTLDTDNVCYNYTMRAESLDVVGFLDKAVTYGARAVQMDPLWPAQGWICPRQAWPSYSTGGWVQRSKSREIRCYLATWDRSW